MRPKKLLLRCYAERDGDMWVAVCLDFSLGAQGESFEEARTKLDLQIRDYVIDAMAGEDREHADALLPRRAPLSFWLKYWYARALTRFVRGLHARASVRARSFKEPLPLVPATC